MDRNMLDLFQRVATLEQQSETQQTINNELLTAIQTLTATLNQSKGALKLIGWVLAILGGVGVVVAWFKP